MSKHPLTLSSGLLLALILGLTCYVLSLAIGGPVLRYLPVSGDWTWHPPEGVISISYYGLILNGALGWILGLTLSRLSPLSKRLSQAKVHAGLETLAITLTLLSLVGITILETTRSHGATSESPRALTIGDMIPDFRLKSESGTDLTRADLLGAGPLVIYFYPKDETQGCTMQALAFREDFPHFIDAGAQVVGVSSDSVASHERFSAHYSLPFTLLSDPDQALRRAFGVPKSLGLIAGRVTYIADKEGTIRHIFDSQLEFTEHASEALKVVRHLSQGASNSRL